VREFVTAWHRVPPRPAFGVATVALLCVAVGDRLTGPDVSFTLLYLGPTAFSTWFVSRRAGMAMSIASAVSAMTSDYATRPTPLPVAVAGWNVAVNLGTYFALVFVLSALKTRLALEQRLARTDPLTMIANRRAFLEQARVELERARRTALPITVVYLDCDDFKVVNDVLGHSQGDALLCKTAATLRSVTRAMDCVARLGGDEFGLLLVDADEATASALIQRVRSALAAATRREGWSVSFSMGAATFSIPPRSVDEMLRHADQLMYAAKRSGKDGLRVETFGDGHALAAGIA